MDELGLSSKSELRFFPRHTPRLTATSGADKPEHLRVHLQEVEDQIFPRGNARCQSKQPSHRCRCKGWEGGTRVAGRSS
nr:hypothetical protein Iba_chr12bCG1980 [Ipomoea batatas]